MLNVSAKRDEVRVDVVRRRVEWPAARRSLGVLDVPVLVVTALVLPRAQLGTVVPVSLGHVQTLVVVEPVHDPVAAEAPERFTVAQLELSRVKAVSCTQPTRNRAV